MKLTEQQMQLLQSIALTVVTAQNNEDGVPDDNSERLTQRLRAIDFELADLLEG